jgi:hypothetical protein
MSKIFYILPGIIAATYLGLASTHAQEVVAGQVGQPALQIPSALQAEHQQLHAKLAAAIGAGGRTGEAAKELQKLLEPHFQKEEQYAMPLLGLLPSLTTGRVPAETRSIIAISDRLKSELPAMLREHVAIAAAVQRLRTAAVSEKKRDAAQFAEMLISHAQQEEQIHYPSAILVGEFLKSKR